MKLQKFLFSVLSLFLCGIILLGCSSPDVSSQVTAQQCPVSLPDGFSMEETQQGHYNIQHDGQVIGGFVQTELAVSDLRIGRSGGSSDPLIAYLESYIESPLEMEFMAGGGICNVETQVSLIAYDGAAKKGHEYDHYLFSRDSVCYDLWLDTELVSHDTRNHILIHAGLYDSRVLFTPAQGFIEPLGCDFTDFTADRCSIVKEGIVVGGIIVTGLEAVSLDAIDTNAYVSTLGPYPEYIAMRGEDFISITVKYTEADTGRIHNSQHYLFIRNGACYDLWLDNDNVPQEERGIFLEAAGIQ